MLTITGGGRITAHSSGGSTVTTTCQAVFAQQLMTLTLVPAFTMSGSGNTVFDMPTYVSRVHIVGTYTGGGSNFIVKIGGLVVNDIIGSRWPSTVSDGTYLTTGGTVEITNSSGVVWSFTEVR